MHSKTCVLSEKRFEINRFPIEFVCHIIYYYYYYLKQFIEKSNELINVSSIIINRFNKKYRSYAIKRG